MNCLIITGGHIDLPFAKNYIEKGSWDCIISADSGLNFCQKADVLPDRILGDFDSVSKDVLDFFLDRYPDRIERFPAEKDETDTELALLRAMEYGATNITILGGTGSRLDHVMGNIHLLKLALDAGIECTLVDACNRIRMIKEGITLKKEEQFGDYVSLLPFTPKVSGLCLSGFAYEVSDFTLDWGKARGVSNAIKAAEATISFSDGILLVIEARDEC